MSPHDIREYVTGVIDLLQQAAAAAASATVDDPRPVNFGWLPSTLGSHRKLIPVDAGCIRMIPGYQLAISSILKATTVGFPEHIATRIKAAIMAAKNSLGLPIHTTHLASMVTRCTNEQNHPGADLSLWPPEDIFPPVAAYSIEFLLRAVTVMLSIQTLRECESCLRYGHMQAANLCQRYIPDLVLDASCSRRMGDLLHALMLVSLHFCGEPSTLETLGT